MNQSLYTTLSECGWVLRQSALSEALVRDLRTDLEKAYLVCREYQIKRGIGPETEGTAHHLLGLGDSFIKLLEDFPDWSTVDEFFEGGKYIVNMYSAILAAQGTKTYVGRMHRDLRSYSGRKPMMLTILVMLDDFTLENGATYLLEGSHLSEEKPSEEHFYKEAKRAVAPAGSMVYFNANIWHAAGRNLTNFPRRALTILLTPPYLKQQADYPRILGYDRTDFSPLLRQLIGYNARVPASLDEYYQPPERRLYQREQG